MLLLVSLLQEFKYVISVEGNAGWTDRLYHLLFLDVRLMVQDHPCPEWYEYQFKPFVHYIPISNNFDNLIGRFEWAEQHPMTVLKMIEDRKLQAERVLGKRGLLSFSATVWAMYSKLMTYEVSLRDDAEVFDESFIARGHDPHGT